MGNRDKKFDKDEALKMLRERNVVKCVVDYSGGNDEGGVDDVTVTYADGTEESNPAWCARTYQPHEYNAETEKWETKPLSKEAQKANEIAEAIEAPVYNRYYSFAGEYYVNGSVEYDVTAGKVVMDGIEEVPTSESVRTEF